MKKLAFVFVVSMLSTTANATCTNFVTIKELLPRSGGWTHVVAQGMSNMDISQCGASGSHGLLVNFNDTTGTQEGKKILLSILLSAYMSGKQVKMCSDGCDSQYPQYSRLDLIDGIQ